jgi:hypothetical protein
MPLPLNYNAPTIMHVDLNSCFATIGVPVVLEQKTTILWKCLYLLAYLKDFPGFGEAYESSRRGGEENHVLGRNTTVNVDKINGFRPLYVWAKTFVFFLTIDRKNTDRCFLYACYGNANMHCVSK